ncbi:MAG: hypothetical protein ACOZF0_21670 [Thermodesulfobacteriota bacterium]
MTPLSINSATEVYRDASRCEIIRHWVDHQALSEFSRSLRAFVQFLGEDVGDEFWRRSLGPIRRLGFAFCSAPLPFSVAAVAVGIDWAKLHRQVRLCEQLFPCAHEAFAELVQQLEVLSSETVSPFIVTLEQIHQQGGELSVVLRNPRMNQAVVDFFSRKVNLRNARVLSPSQLRNGHLCHLLAAIGPCGWFPEHVFSAPRAVAVHVISLRWIRDPWKPGPVFLHELDTSGKRSRNHRIGMMPSISDKTSLEENSPTDIFPVDLLPPCPSFGHNERSMAGQSNTSEETVPARLCHLSGQRASFVATYDGSSTLIIDTSETGNAVVRRIPAEELEPGHYLLLRTSGGGDLIAPLADRIMGDLAEKRRSEQTEWKQRLISAAAGRFGSVNCRELSAFVSAELQSRNLSQARQANVNYWMSSKCIRPRKIEDFIAILTFAGLEERSQELWEAMGDIDRAHKRAGFAIRRLLLHKIGTTSLEPLERNGEMVFELSEEDGGTISAFQITEIIGEEYEVPIQRIGVLLEIED